MKIIAVGCRLCFDAHQVGECELRTPVCRRLHPHHCKMNPDAIVLMPLYNKVPVSICREKGRELIISDSKKIARPMKMIPTPTNAREWVADDRKGPQGRTTASPLARTDTRGVDCGICCNPYRVCVLVRSARSLRRPPPDRQTRTTRRPVGRTPLAPDCCQRVSRRISRLFPRQPRGTRRAGCCRSPGKSS